MERFGRILWPVVLAFTVAVGDLVWTSPGTATSPAFHQLTLMHQVIRMGAVVLPLAALTLILLVAHNRAEASSAAPASTRSYTRPGSGR